MPSKQQVIPTRFLRNLRVFGFDEVEPVILAALITQDPLLLIGKAGTGKTFLLNSISEAMGLEHRHYNASLLSFDDLIGYPYPSAESNSISFLPTPATIWKAESVLVDELSRCKPETQNKFFSIIHERKIQGLPLEHLVYRWAAMNPFAFSGDESEEQYEGSQPLDPALADRFGFIIEVPDWPDLSKEDQDAVIHPSGESAISNDAGSLLHFIKKVRPPFLQALKQPLPEVTSYCRVAASLLTEAGLRISPRRARLLARNITALYCVSEALGHSRSEEKQKKLHRLALTWSLPHRAYREQLSQQAILSAHVEAFRIATQTNAKERWVSEFLLADSISEKIKMLLESPIDKDTKSMAVLQLLGKESLSRKAIFAFSTFPYFSENEFLQEEALHELVKIASPVIEVNGKIKWRELGDRKEEHPLWSRCQQVLSSIAAMDSVRRNKARNLFLYLFTCDIAIPDPEEMERELNACFETIRTHSSLK